MTDIRAQAVEAFGKMTPAQQAQHKAAWQRIEDFVRSLAPKKAKVFEVHHSIEHARTLYLTELLKGLPSDLCERFVSRAYGKES